MSNNQSNNESDAFVFFGATGDLAYKQIFPALQGLVKEGKLNIPVIGVAKSDWTPEQLQARARESLEKNGGVDSEAFGKLCTLFKYVGGDYGDDSTFQKLRKVLGDAKRPLYYLAIPPDLFGEVAEKLKAANCVENARVVVEKPFGSDLDSAKKLNQILHKYFAEENIFRIDHFLGKEAVQNLIYFRFANPVVQACWNSTYIESVQITMAESFGVSDRGKLYDEEGTVRDVVQNHLLQVVACLAMESPDADGWRAHQDKRSELLEKVRSVKVDDAVRGQFKGYQNVKGVNPNSKTETFIALRLFIDNERWKGVPFFIRAGKCLPSTATEVVVRFRENKSKVVDGHDACKKDFFRLRLGPEQIIALGLNVKKPGEGMTGEPTELMLKRDDSKQMPPYVRLLSDAMKGDATLFAREDSVEAAWRIVDPILGEAVPLFEYEQNSWGPSEAYAKIEPEDGWVNPST